MEQSGVLNNLSGQFYVYYCPERLSMDESRPGSL